MAGKTVNLFLSLWRAYICFVNIFFNTVTLGKVKRHVNASNFCYYLYISTAAGKQGCEKPWVFGILPMGRFFAKKQGFCPQTYFV